MELKSCRVGAVGAVADLDRARAFYEGKLGLEPDEEQTSEGTVAYTVGGGTGLFLYKSEENAGTNRATAFGWEVEDVEQAVTELSEAGVAFERYDEPVRTDERGIMEMDGFRVAWFKDPDGNIHALNGS